MKIEEMSKQSRDRYHYIVSDSDSMLSKVRVLVTENTLKDELVETLKEQIDILKNDVANLKRQVK